MLRHAQIEFRTSYIYCQSPLRIVKFRKNVSYLDDVYVIHKLVEELLFTHLKQLQYCFSSGSIYINCNSSKQLLQGFLKKKLIPPWHNIRRSLFSELFLALAQEACK